MNIRYTRGPLPEGNHMLPVSRAQPAPNQKWAFYEETWERFDRKPDTLPSDYKLWRLHYHTHYNPDRAIRQVQQALATYTDIKQHGFNYADHPIIRTRQGRIHTGHTLTAILRHLHPAATIEVSEI